MLQFIASLFRFLPLSKRTAILEAAYLSLPMAERWRQGRPSSAFYFSHLQQQGWQPGTIIDVGAFQGDWTREMMAIFPEAQYFCIEAQEEKVNMLRHACNGKDVTIIQALLGANTAANVPFYAMESGSSVLRELSGGNAATRLLPMTTLDAIFANETLKGHCLLKLDVQGYELEVLKGATALLPAIDCIQLEVSWLNYNHQAPLLAEVLPVLLQMGFVPFEIPGIHRRKDNWALIQSDIIFCRPDWEWRKKANNFTQPYEVVAF